MGKGGRPKVIRNEDVIGYIKECMKDQGTAPSRQAIQEMVPGPHKATLCRRLDEEQKAGNIVSFIHDDDEKPRYVPVDMVKTSLEKIIDILPTEKLYDVATDLFRERKLSLIGQNTRVDEFLVQKVQAYLQKQELETPETFNKQIPFSELDQKICDYICEQVHTTRPEIQNVLNIKKVEEIKPRLKRIGFYENISFIHGPRGVKVYFSWDKVKDLDKEVYPYITQRAAQRLRELEKEPGIIGEHDVLKALGYETVPRDYNHVATPLLHLLYKKRAKQMQASEAVPKQSEVSKPHLISANELLVDKLAEKISEEYRSKDDLLKIARCVTKEKRGLDNLIQLLETHGYEIQTKENEGERFYSLPSPLKKRGQRAEVMFLSEVGYDTDFFNPEAYGNLLKLIAQRKDGLSAILLSGAIQTLKRPEILNDALTYWFANEEHAIAESQRIPNSKQYETMLDKQLDIFKERLKELKKQAPDTQIYVQLVTDDWQDTIDAMLNEMLVRDKEDALQHIKERRAEKSALTKEYKTKKRALDRSEGEDAELAQEVADYERHIQDIENEISTTTTHRGLYRPKKARPAHQVTQAQFVHYITRKVEDVCKEAGVTLVSNATETLNVNGMTVKWVNSLDVESWAVFKRPDKKLDALLLEDSDKDIDVVAVSGHYGMGYTRTQRMKYSPAQGNHELKKYDTTLGDKVRTGILATPFEDQEKIARYAQGREPERLGGGKPRGTRSHAAFKRMKNDSVSGIYSVIKTEEGLIAREFIQYADFITGRALERLEKNAKERVESDQHLDSPQEDKFALQGGQVTLEREARTPTQYRGRPAFIRRFTSLGDTAEAPPIRWQFMQENRPDPEEQPRKIADQILKVNKERPEEVAALALLLANEALMGIVNSGKVIATHTADYYEKRLKPILETSSLQIAFFIIPGNHYDDIAYKMGFKEFDLLVERLRYREWELPDGRKEPVRVYVVGESDEAARKEARGIFGGYQNNRQAVDESYGKTISGENLCLEPSLVVGIHDPKGSDFYGLEAACKKFEADISYAGHTHEHGIKLVKRGPNKVSFAFRAATMQNPTPTEFIYPSHPRTQGAHNIIHPKPGQLYDEFLPGAYLRAEGMRAFNDEVKWKIALQRKNDNKE